MMCVYLSKVNDDSAAGNITFEAEVRVEGQFSASRNGQTDAVQVVPSTGSSQSSVLQVTRGASTSGNLPAIEVIQNGTETAQIQFDGRGRFSDVEITTETNAAALGTDANGKIINVGSTLDGSYLSSTEDDSAAGKITFEDDVTAEAGVTLDATKNAGALGTDANGTIIDVGSTLDGKYLSSTQDDTAAGAITLRVTLQQKREFRLPAVTREILYIKSVIIVAFHRQTAPHYLAFKITIRLHQILATQSF